MAETRKILSFNKNNYQNDLIKVLSDVVIYLQKSEESGWTDLTPEEVVNIIKKQIESLRTENKIDKEELIMLFLPTSDIQEISMANNWSDEYMSFSSRFDNLIQKV